MVTATKAGAHASLHCLQRSPWPPASFYAPNAISGGPLEPEAQAASTVTFVDRPWRSTYDTTVSDTGADRKPQVYQMLAENNKIDAQNDELRMDLVLRAAHDEVDSSVNMGGNPGIHIIYNYDDGSGPQNSYVPNYGHAVNCKKTLNGPKGGVTWANNGEYYIIEKAIESSIYDYLTISVEGDMNIPNEATDTSTTYPTDINTSLPANPTAQRIANMQTNVQRRIQVGWTLDTAHYKFDVKCPDPPTIDSVSNNIDDKAMGNDPKQLKTINPSDSFNHALSDTKTTLKVKSRDDADSEATIHGTGSATVNGPAPSWDVTNVAAGATASYTCTYSGSATQWFHDNAAASAARFDFTAKIADNMTSSGNTLPNQLVDFWAPQTGLATTVSVKQDGAKGKMTSALQGGSLWLVITALAAIFPALGMTVMRSRQNRGRHAI